MTNPRLKKQIVEVVENQIRDNDPPFTKSTLLQLQKQGCTKKEAKEMIAAVLLEEMYDVLKYKKKFNEKKYEDKLKALLNDDFIFDDAGEALIEQEDMILQAKYNFYDALSEYDSKKAISIFMDIWDKIKKYVEDEFYIIDANNNKIKPELMDIDNKTDFKYEFFNWFQDVEMELGNERMHKKRIDFSKEILELFKWKSDSPDNYKTAIGEAFNDLEEYKACDDWFEAWLNEEPDNPNAINIYLFCIITRDDMDRAVKITEEYIDKIEKCTMENDILFIRAMSIYEAMGNHEKAKIYYDKIEAFRKEISKSTLKNDKTVYFNKPIKKGKKIPRNAPCPCGSGKKYKKCCGKN